MFTLNWGLNNNVTKLIWRCNDHLSSQSNCYVDLHNWKTVCKFLISWWCHAVSQLVFLCCWRENRWIHEKFPQENCTLRNSPSWMTPDALNENQQLKPTKFQKLDIWLILHTLLDFIVSFEHMLFFQNQFFLLCWIRFVGRSFPTGDASNSLLQGKNHWIKKRVGMSFLTHPVGVVAASVARCMPASFLPACLLPASLMHRVHQKCSSAVVVSIKFNFHVFFIMAAATALCWDFCNVLMYGA